MFKIILYTRAYAALSGVAILALVASAQIHAQTSGAVDHSAHLNVEQAQPATGHHDAHLHIEDDIELAATAYTTETDGLPLAQAVQIVELQDGDIYTVTAAYVKKQIGNHTLRMLAYNGSVPGPLIKVTQGSQITIQFNNNTDVDQTIHSHGVRVDNLSDGVPGLTQDSVKPGESYTYTLKFIDAGVFWYHPHTREDYGQELGLYGNYLITPSAGDYWGKVDREIPLVIDDLLIENNQIARFYQEFTNYALLGRFGNQYLVNGQSGYRLDVRQGELIRFFVTNVSNARTYKLSIPGLSLKIAGADLGRYEHEFITKDFLVSPAERMVVEACFDTPGAYTLTHTLPDRQVHLAGITVSTDTTSASACADDFGALRKNVDVSREFSGFRDWLRAEPDKSLLLTIALNGQQIDHSVHAHSTTQLTVPGPVTETINPPAIDHSGHSGHDMGTATPQTQQASQANAMQGMQWDDPEHSDRTQRTPQVSWKLIDTSTGKDSAGIDDWVFRQGQLVKIRLTNDTKADHVMQHPVHLHGQQFVVLASDGVANDNLVWKDTTLVLPGQTVDLLVSMTNTGVWMLHCHIAEHLHAGMMLTFRVEDQAGHAAGDGYRLHAGKHSH